MPDDSSLHEYSFLLNAFKMHYRTLIKLLASESLRYVDCLPFHSYIYSSWPSQRVSPDVAEIVGLAVFSELSPNYFW